MSKVGAHFDRISKRYDFYKTMNNFYYSNLKKTLLDIIPKESLVLEIGCGTGDLLYTLKPKIGYGLDISRGMIQIAKNKYKDRNLVFSTVYPTNIKFDYIFMSDVIEHLEEPDVVFKRVYMLLKRDGLFINTMANPMWEPFLILAEKLGLKMPEGPHERISVQSLRNKLNDAGLEIVNEEKKLLIPIKIPIITNLFNRYLENYLKKYAFIQITVAKKT